MHTLTPLFKADLVFLANVPTPDIIIQKLPFFKNLQYLQENTCAGVFFNKVAGCKACNFIKKRLQHRCFPVNIAKLLGKTFFIEQLLWLLLNFVVCQRILQKKYLRNILKARRCTSIKHRNTIN